MKILQLVTKRQYRGAEVFAANLSEELIGFGHEIIFAGLYKNEKDVLSVENADNVDLSDNKTSSFSFQLLRNIIGLIRSSKPDVVQCNGSDTLKYMVAASYFIPKTPIIYRNISMISEWIANTPKKILYKNLFKRVSHVSSVGEEAIADLVNTFNFPLQQTSVIRRGIPIIQIDEKKARQNLKDQFNLKRDDKIIMHIGNFSPEKNHIFLLDIFSKINKDHPNIKLVLVGDGTLFKTIKEEVKTRNLENTVFLTGFRKDIPELLAASDVFVLCSKVEGVPGVILEAAAQKKPSIATNVGGVLEVLENNKTGFIIDNFNKQNFINKIIKLCIDENLRESLGEKAYSLVLKEFNPVKNARKFEDLYCSLTDLKINQKEKKELRILQIIQKKQYRGAEIFASQLSNHLIELGHKVEIVSIYQGEANLPFVGAIRSLNSVENRRYYDFNGWKSLALIVKEFKPDVVQANAADTLKYAIFSKLVFNWNIPVIYRNASASSFYIKNRASWKLNSFLFSKTDLIISVSNASKMDLNNLFDFTKKKSIVIPVGIDLNIKQGEIKDLFTEDKKHIIHIGSFTPEKNHKGLISIFNKVIQKAPNSILHLVGSGPLEREIKNAIKKAQIEKAIIFHGEIQNPMNLIRSADILVLPSKIEGLPGVILEALVCKTPVVAYDVGGVSEVLNKDTGSLIESGNEEMFLEAIMDYLSNKNIQQIEKAYNIVAKEYMNEILALKFADSYNQLVMDKQ